MSNNYNVISHQQINVGGISVHVALAGDSANQAILFLHGYPESWQEFEGVMNGLKDTYYVLAIDLPGIGMSEPIASGNKRCLAEFINQVLEVLHLDRIVLVGHDIGGMTAYSFIKKYPEKLHRAVIMNTVIPGVDPWEQVKRNPISGILPCMQCLRCPKLYLPANKGSCSIIFMTPFLLINRPSTTTSGMNMQTPTII
jgi:pimeloyl-ACP methyl ester carboxylesterase